MADPNPKDDLRDRNVELPGDTSSADIVGRTGEEMPIQSHDGVESDERERRAVANEEGLEPVRTDDDNAHGRVAD
jgi:hypothetical protein